MKRTIKHFLLLCVMMLMIACGQPEVEPGLEAIPTVAEPTQEPLPTATESPTNTPNPTSTPAPLPEPTQVEESTKSNDDLMGDELAEMLGMRVFSEGTMAMETLGISFEIPEGWSSMEMMGVMAMATNSELDTNMLLDTPTGEEGVVLLFLPSGGESFEKMTSYTTEELVAEMQGIGSDFEFDEMQVAEDQVEVTVNGYNGVRTSIEWISEGAPMFMEMSILESEGIGYTMMYLGTLEDYEYEQENYNALMNTLVLTPPDEAAFEEASEEMLEDLSGMFVGGVVTEGRIDLPGIGVSFEVPAGWMAMDMMAFLGMATNSSMDMMMSDDQMTEGVVLMFAPAEGASIDEAWESASVDMFGDLSGLSDEEIEIIEERVPVTVNGYAGARTSATIESEGMPGFMEITILEHEGSIYSMVYAGAMADYEAEQANYDFLINSLILAEPDLDAVKSVDFYDNSFDGDFSVPLPLTIDPLPVSETISFDAGNNIGYQIEVDVGESYLIYLSGETDPVLNLFPDGVETAESVDDGSNNVEVILWTADVPSLIVSGEYLIDEGAGPLTLTVLQTAEMENNLQAITVNEGEAYVVVGFDEQLDIILTVTYANRQSTIDDNFGGEAELVFLTEQGDYEIAVTEWNSNEPSGSLYIVSLPDGLVIPTADKH